ncbi:DnaB-like helicase N-terminal domain-containing protein [Paraburkholderia sp. HD33-4]|uniref:DnaB-like helicase N-terminal domain-containing protein n=1 Tax=Paraburkholderia sp. HD33-4 TaxID=2883242 RepID=UPI001F435EA7|nr:DnaB-like helicase N-terminal domain-containing protein [Paraburkholderia sp. HD33-4]
MIRFENDLTTVAERRLLAVLLREPDSIRHVQKLAPGEFSHALHGELCRAILAVIDAGETMNYANVVKHLHHRMKRVPAGWLSYLLDLGLCYCDPINVGYYAAVMRWGTK